jgi:hypothetical protein
VEQKPDALAAVRGKRSDDEWMQAVGQQPIAEVSHDVTTLHALGPQICGVLYILSGLASKRDPYD